MNPELSLTRLGVTGRGRSDGDRVEVEVHGDQHLVIIHSPRGISEVTLQRLGETWPERVVVQMRLKGLESLTVSGGEMAVQAAVSTGRDRAAIRQWPVPDEQVALTADEQVALTADEQVALTANDPLWLDLRIIPGGQAETVRGFEWTVPWGLQQVNPRELRVNFIDFYR
jgi:hypothetical protein